MTDTLKLLRVLDKVRPRDMFKDQRGNWVKVWRADADRYLFDFKLCPPSEGWQQFDTDQDAPYFGVWVNIDKLLTFTYAEGDLSLTVCSDPAHMKAELDYMAEFYGSPPPCAISIDRDGAVTKYYDKRPSMTA